MPHKDASSYCFSIDQQVNLFFVWIPLFCVEKKSNCKKAGGFARHSLLVAHADQSIRMKDL